MRTPKPILDAGTNSRLVAAAILVCVLSGCSGRPSAANDAQTGALVADLESFAARLAAADEFSGVVLLARHGQALMRQGYGLVSKMFTAVAIAKLVERKRLAFDSKLGSLLPEYPSADAREQVTVHHLLTMSSGSSTCSACQSSGPTLTVTSPRRTSGSTSRHRRFSSAPDSMGL